MKYKNLALALALGVSLSACGSNTNNNSQNESKTEETKTSETQNKVEEKNDNENSAEKNDEQNVVYTSFYPIYNLAKQIAGDKMEVKSFTNLKSESHGWEPSAKDIAELSESQIMFINGAGMEEWEDSVDDSTEVEIVNTSEGLDLIKAEPEDDDHDHEDEEHENEENEEAHEENENEEDHDEEDHDHEHNHGEFDPHTWLSPKNGVAQAKVIADKLSEVDPANKDYYMENYKKIEDELNSMIDEYTEKFEKSENKNFLVNHKAFSYIARDFNLNQIALTSLTSTDDTDAKTLKEAAEKAKELNINTIFYEMGGSDKSAKTLADEIGAEIIPLNTLELATDEDLDNNKTYQELIKYNLEEIYKSLEK